MTKYYIMILVMLSGIYCSGQTNSDSVYSSTRLVPRFGINIQKGYGIEAGLFLNKFYTRFPRVDYIYLLPYASSGFYLASELNFKSSDELIIGPKVGWELGVIGETHGSYFGAEFIYYTDLKRNSTALMVKVGLPLLWFNVGYGFTKFFNSDLKNDIGKHRFLITYIFNREAKREQEKLQINWENKQKKDK